MSKVAVNGAMGRMGQQAASAIEAEASLTLVGQWDKQDQLTDVLREAKPDVVVDFTHPSCVRQNVETIVKAGVHVVVGTTGLSDADLEALKELARIHQVGVLVIPNFAIGAVLMMKFATEAARYMPRVEIIEYHHDQKADAPSGTAIKTAQWIASANPSVNQETLLEHESYPGARGGVCDRIQIHSVRLPGYVACQEVILGSVGQTLTIRHDTISRECFMSGVILSIKSVFRYSGELVYGLERLLDWG